MFEVGFSEILVILGLALIVLGPEKLPKLAAQLGRWTGRARAMARQLKAQLDQEVHFQEQRERHGRGDSPVPPKTTESAPAEAASTPPPDAAPAADAVAPAPTASGADSTPKPGNE